MGSVDRINGRCQEMMPQGVKGQRALKMCGMLPEDACHRYYACREGCDEDFASCESRDRHEANVHGDGW